MRPDRWRQIEAVFQAALEHDPSTRGTFLDQVCGSDPALRREVESLLQADERAGGFMEPPEAPPEAPDLLDRLQSALGSAYEVERELGGGGMSRIFVAMETALNRQVVIKVLRPELAAEVDAERFHREIRLAARLHHPHLVPVHSAGQAEHLLYYTMPFVEGQSLRHRLEMEGPLPIPEVVGILREVTDALAYAHRQGVIHRDLKPANILLEEGHALITDFGIAKALSTAAGEGPQDVTLTSSGIAGTPGYMAPEQVTGAAVDRRADFYALGCLAYELLTGHPPFARASAQALMLAHVNEKPVPVTGRRADVPRALAALIMRLLEKRPGDRPQSTNEILRELEAAGSDDSASWDTRRWPRRGAVVTIGALVAMGILSIPPRGHPDPPASIAKPSLLAVLPFESAVDSSERAFADGMSEELVTRLVRVPGLMLVARSSAQQYRRTGQTASAFGRALGVDYVLEGTVRTAVGAGGEKRIRITPELIKVADGTHIWAAPYEGVLSDVFRLQADVAQQVAEALRGKLAPGERRTVRAGPTDDVEAYRLYLLGRAEWNHRTPDALQRAAANFRQAIGRDSSFARAWAGLADAYALYEYYGVRELPRDTAYSWAERAALRAIGLDSTLAEPHASLSQIYLYGHMDRARSGREARRAVELDPSYPPGRHWWAEHLLFSGQVDAAVAEATKAVEIDPLSTPVRNMFGSALWSAGRTEEAIAAFRAAAAQDRSANLPWLNLFLIYVSQGRSKEALDVLAATRDTSAFAHDLARARDDPRARAAAIRALARVKTPPSLLGLGGHYATALFYVLLDEREAALSSLERAVAARDPALEGVKVEPLLRPLRGDPRYNAVVQAVGLTPS